MKNKLLNQEICRHLFSYSHLPIFSSSHLLIFPSSHLPIFSSSLFLIFSLSHLLSFSSSLFLIFSLSHLSQLTASFFHLPSALRLLPSSFFTPLSSFRLRTSNLQPLPYIHIPPCSVLLMISFCRSSPKSLK